MPVPERDGPEGMLRALDEEALRAALEGLDAEAAAVCLLWGFRHPEHERRAAELLEEALPGTDVRLRTRPRGSSASTSAARPRSWTLPDPLLRGYLERLGDRARAAGLPEPEVMLSSGGTASAGDGGAARVVDGALGTRGRRRRRRAHRGGGGERSGSTWAAPRATSR